jgi:hypothetical protein
MKRDSDSILASLDNNTATNRMLSVRVNGRSNEGVGIQVGTSKRQNA